ncbi:hypothetical protein [Undibacterium squillarum]|uniref:hypothetical protein n=1 Tax=Undibacterium squillarum TaxID=1131567 RepID=UPI0035AE0886
MADALTQLLSGGFPSSVFPLLLNAVQLTDVLSYMLSTGLPALFMLPVLRKAGFSAWWFFPACVPYLNVVLLLLFAFVRWPDRSRSAY